MIVYHGFPSGLEHPIEAQVFGGRHVMLSHATEPGGLERVARYAASIALDNGAFTAWKGGREMDIEGFYEWIRIAVALPAVAWFLVPDVIDGDEAANDRLIDDVPSDVRAWAVPVWHLHESVERFATLCRAWPRVALGSSGPYSTPGARNWWERMEYAMDSWVPTCRLHGLRMADPDIVRRLPFASVDSTTAARHANAGIKFQAPFNACRPETRVRAYCEHLESARAPTRPEWGRTPGTLWELMAGGAA